jgi:hypothetical protein
MRLSVPVRLPKFLHTRGAWCGIICLKGDFVSSAVPAADLAISKGKKQNAKLQCKIKIFEL